MKTTEELENLLRDLTPRSPSARLRSRIFGRPAAEKPAWGWRPARLAFASMVGVALILTVRQYPPAVSGNGGADQAWMMAAMSNQTLAAYVTRHDSPQWNLPSASLQGTNFLPPVSRPGE